MSERFEVVVIGSGAGGGVVAGELAERGRSVLLLETGPHRTAADFTRWEVHAMHDIWWPMRFAFPVDPAAGVPPVALISGRCVGGSTTINTKVALRASQHEYDKWNAATGLGFGPDDLEPHYDRVSSVLGIRERADWPDNVKLVAKGFEAMGSKLEPVLSYTDENCMKCGSCLQGCPTNAGKSTQNTYIQHAWAHGKLDLRAGCYVERVVIDDRGDGPEATGVEYTDSAGERHVVDADAVVVAGGTLGTPQILLRSEVPNDQIGRNFGLHPASFVFGLFDEPQDAHRVYPITGHCMDFQRDEDGGFVIEALSVQDPIGFTVSVCDENGPMWGQELVDVARKYRNWIGLLLMCNDDNNGTVGRDENGAELITSNFQPAETERMRKGADFSADVLRAAGAKRILWSGPATTHMQGSARMGSDASNSVVDRNGESHDIKRLFVGDSSLIPRTLSVNPSLTIMALATRLAEHLDANERGYLRGNRELVA